VVAERGCGGVHAVVAGDLLEAAQSLPAGASAFHDAADIGRQARVAGDGCTARFRGMSAHPIMEEPVGRLA
jgi:hypothetical protein